MKIYFCIIIALFVLGSCNYRQKESPLVGEWSFIEGYSNGKPNFINEEHRIKVFNSNGMFYISHNENGNEYIDIKGKYKTIDGDHFKEILNRSTSVIYVYEIENDTLTFEGELKFPIGDGNYRSVLVKEKWVKNDHRNN